jgi:Protein of unknown function (DUF3500)
VTLVAAGLSLAGYVTVATIMGLENVLDRIEGFTATFDRERGRDPGLYYLRVFGTPGDTGAWGYRCGSGWRMWPGSGTRWRCSGNSHCDGRTLIATRPHPRRADRGA